MESINDRIAAVYKISDIKQFEFAEKIGVSQAYISKLFKEDSDKTPSDRLIRIISTEFNVDENWLRTGEGEMFNVSDELSLDEYAKQHNMSDMDLKIIKGFLDLDPEVRKIVVSTFSKALSEDRSEVKEKSNAVVEIIDRNKDQKGLILQKASTPTEGLMAAESEPKYMAGSIDAEIESYRRELEVERQNKTLSALPGLDGNIG